MKINMLIMLLVIILFCSSCMPGPNSAWGGRRAPAGFFFGIWHGIIAFFSLLFSIFTDVRIYECNNTGFGYDLGYFLGIAGIFGGGTRIVFHGGKK